MKYIIISISVILVLFIISQIWAWSTTNDIEMYSYKVIQEYDEFEIRKYESANFAFVTTNSGKYSESSGSGFRMLAGYIFGGNEENQKIAMTSPVEMVLQDSMTMKFMVPAQYEIEDLPIPNDSRVRFVSEPEKTVAAIRFSGFANDEKIGKYKKRLSELLDKEAIEHTGNFSFFGYDPPMTVVNRRNEVVVEILNTD